MYREKEKQETFHRVILSFKHQQGDYVRSNVHICIAEKLSNILRISLSYWNTNLIKHYEYHSFILWNIILQFQEKLNAATGEVEEKNETRKREPYKLKNRYHVASVAQLYSRTIIWCNFAFVQVNELKKRVCTFLQISICWGVKQLKRNFARYLTYVLVKLLNRKMVQSKEWPLSVNDIVPGFL